MRQRYLMTEEEFNEIVDASKPVVHIMTHIGFPRSPQENANAAWKKLGEKHNFNYISVVPDLANGERAFTAEPRDPHE